MSWSKRLNPVPTFPSYSGPCKVGSVDVEIAISELQSPSTSPPPVDISTVSFRVFYPCKQESGEKGAKWVPAPQREHLGALAKFMGASNAFAAAFSLLPQLLNHTRMPVHEDADILSPATSSKRWPIMIFCHGLGGSRNTYSHICGSLASHGMIVVAPEHRDGSAPLALIRSSGQENQIKRVGYRNIAHESSVEVYKARDEQLRIRLWELGMIHDALSKMDAGASMENVAHGYAQKSTSRTLGMFSSLIDMHQPGSMIFAGHSFGACTAVQFVKSVYYQSKEQVDDYKPLYMPSSDSALARQITPRNPLVLLDLWTLPIKSPDTAWLRSKSLPCYDSANGGQNLISILSEAFYKWSSNYQESTATVAKPPSSQSKYPNQPGPYIFYPLTSAHLSQSDFGVLFPWLSTKVFGAKDPGRLLRLNARAILEVLRQNGIPVAHTSARDMEMDEKTANGENIEQDVMILSRTKDSVHGWIVLGTDSEESKEESVRLNLTKLQVSVDPPVERQPEAS